MPAVTVDDTLTLPRVAEPDRATSTDRAVTTVTTAPRGFEGEGFPVRRAFAGVDLDELDPFIHMDQMGEVEYAPGEPKGTSWHPHRGFETVTYMIDGTFLHQDSHGGGGVITDGATQWMTAGSGILHIETPPEALVASGGLFHGIQLWVNLPAPRRWSSPAYQDLEGDDVTLLDLARRRRPRPPDRRRARRPPGTGLHPVRPSPCSTSPSPRVRRSACPGPSDFNGLVYGLSRCRHGGRRAAPASAPASWPSSPPATSSPSAGSASPDSRTDAFDVLVLGGQRSASRSPGTVRS